MLAAQNEQRAEGGDVEGGGGAVVVKALKQPHFNSPFSFDGKCFTFFADLLLETAETLLALSGKSGSSQNGPNLPNSLQKFPQQKGNSFL